MTRNLAVATALLLTFAFAAQASALDSPWISDVYFYWYQWDYARQLGSWVNGVYNTPLYGYYDSARYADNLRELHLAGEWGITHHFMDFWGHAWLDEKGRPRERCLMDAAEELRRRGYDCWMSYYQDGNDFQMDDFARNLDPGRAVEGWVRNYAASPAWPKIDGKPVQLVYGRNGRPKVTATDEGFRQWLRAKYGSLDGLRAAWKQDLPAWDGVKWNAGVVGVQRADSILYQYDLWRKSWDEVNRIVQKKYGFPGLLASFDIAYRPYMGWGYSLQTKTFCGPHSYGGIFGQPQDQDVERFIQAAVAKWYGKVFFDTFKNFYHDWEIRIPGTCYPPDPYHFDRFWILALSHYAEALLHLSWNEWWEGSNLEPCWEWGKTFCEKNQLYSTAMKACFASIKQAQTTGQVAVLLNDWHWLVSGRRTDDIYGVIQALRAQSVDFKLLPDDFVTARNLADVQLVVVPTGGTGMGFNAAGQPISDVLLQWLKKSPRHKLILGKLPGAELPAVCGSKLLRALGMTVSPPQPRGPLAASVNAYVEVGEPGDEQFIVSGASHGEDWGKLPPQAFGARTRHHTVRWCPATGNSTVLLLPIAPGKDHVLAMAGDALWPNQVTVFVESHRAGSFAVKSGYHEYEVKIPAKLLPRAGLATFRFEFAKRYVPAEIDPKRFPNERRVCDLALDWVHLRTTDQPAHRKIPAVLPRAKVVFTGPLRGVEAAALSLVWQQVTASNAQVLSSSPGLGVNRDLLVDGKQVWYCNGYLGEVSDFLYWRAVLDWAGVKSLWMVAGDHLLGARLQAGTTTLLAAYSTDIRKPQAVDLDAPAGDIPLAEIQVITRDGRLFSPLLPSPSTAETFAARDELQYYGLYQFTCCPVRPQTPPMTVAPSTQVAFPVTLVNLTAKKVRGSLTLRSFLPSLTAPWVDFVVPAGKQTQVTLKLTAREDLDWGAKTAVLIVKTEAGKAYFWRRVEVLDAPHWQATTVAWAGDTATARITSLPHRWAKRATAERIEAWIGDRRIALRDALRPGEHMDIAIPRALLGASDESEAQLSLRYQVLGQRRTARLALKVPPRVSAKVSAPKDALVAFSVAGATTSGPRIVTLDPPAAGWPSAPDGSLVLRDGQGRLAPAALLSDASQARRSPLVAALPSLGSGPFFLCRASSPPPTDLRVEKRGDGRVQVRNGELLVVFDPARGGTVTELRWRGGRNMARRSFGVSWGRFGRFAPLHPRITADKYLAQERKRYQADDRATVQVIAATPAWARVQVRQVRPGLSIQQTYDFWAYVPYFRVMSMVSLTKDFEGDEVAVLDVPLERGEWNKIFPNFTGVVRSKPAIHGGWRQGPYVPPCATVMERGTFLRSLSLIDIKTSPGVVWWRQGFYPRRRGTVGTIDTARLEIVARHPRPGTTLTASALVFLHDGYQLAAQRLQDQLRAVRVQWLALAGRREVSAPTAKDWWCQVYEARLPVEGKPVGRPLEARVPAGFAGRWFTPESLRAVWQGDGRYQVLESAATPLPGDKLRVVVEPSQVPLGQGRLYLYGHLQDERPALLREAEAGVPDPSFERGGEGWSKPPNALDRTVAHSGSVSARLEAPTGGYSLLATDRVEVVPGHSSVVSFWARTKTPGATVVVNFYGGGGYDFHHVSVPLKADGQWHRYQVEVPAGDFPAGMRLSLRLWVYHHPGPVWIDDIKCQAPEVPASEARVGKVEQLESAKQRP